jgi:hypothetical protein
MPLSKIQKMVTLPPLAVSKSAYVAEQKFSWLSHSGIGAAAYAMCWAGEAGCELGRVLINPDVRLSPRLTSALPSKAAV